MSRRLDFVLGLLRCIYRVGVSHAHLSSTVKTVLLGHEVSEGTRRKVRVVGVKRIRGTGLRSRLYSQKPLSLYVSTDCLPTQGGWGGSNTRVPPRREDCGRERNTGTR